MTPSFSLRSAIFLLAAAFSTIPAVSLDKDVVGELQLVGAGSAEKLAGVWIDGQYVGYMKELKGSNRLRLLPGRHEVTLRHVGYADFTSTVVVEPGQTQVLHVALAAAPAPSPATATAEVRLLVHPKRAAVFVDDAFAGHVDEFDSPGQGMLVPPGKHRIKIVLPGYREFETVVDLAANQKFELKTELQKGSILGAGPQIKQSRAVVVRGGPPR
jgi:hypothetical protein